MALGSVDFNKCCEERRGVRLPPAGRPVAYVQCPGCGFAFAPAFRSWTAADFARDIYNDGYAEVDPDAAEVRPQASATTLLTTFGGTRRPASHLDYGGGAGRLAELLRAAGWRSVSWDPFFDQSEPAVRPGRVQLITCYEVFEHVADVQALMARLAGWLAPDGLLLASTLLSDGDLRPGEPPGWWYASPRNGHISLFSARSLALLAERHGLKVGSFNRGQHALWRNGFPRWANHLLQGS